MKNIPELIEYLKHDKQRTPCREVALMFSVCVSTVIRRELAIGFSRRGCIGRSGRPRLVTLKHGSRVVALRDTGATWAEIGKKLKFSRQCAQQIYSRMKRGFWQSGRYLNPTIYERVRNAK